MTAIPARLRTSPAAGSTLAAVGTALGAFALGVVLAVAGAGISVWAMLALPLCILAGRHGLSRPPWALAVVFAALPIGLAPAVLGLQVVEVAVLAAVSLMVTAAFLQRRAVLGWAPPLAWLAALLGVAVLATPGALDTGMAVKQGVTLFAGFLLVLAFLGTSPGMEEIRRLVGVFVTAGAAMCVYALATTPDLSASYGGGVVENRAAGSFVQPNELGSFSAMVLLVALGWWNGARTTGARLAGAAASAVAAWALVLSLSRGAWIGTVVGLAGFLVLAPTVRRRMLAVAGLGLLLAVGFAVSRPDDPQVVVIRARASNLTNQAANPYDFRPAIYEEARREIRAKPVFGQGPGNFPVASARTGSKAQTVAALHAHNVLLTTAAEIGLAGAGLLVVFTLSVGASVRRRLVRLANADRVVVAGLAGALLAVVGQGLVDFTLRNPSLLMVVFSLLALLLSGVGLPPHGPVGAEPDFDRSPKSTPHPE